MALRVRWGNVGRAAGGVALVGLVVAWPRLAGPVPVAPGGEARAVVAGAAPRGEVAPPAATPRKRSVTTPRKRSVATPRKRPHATPRKRSVTTPRKRSVTSPRKRKDRRTALVGRDRIGMRPSVAPPAPAAPPSVVPAPGPSPPTVVAPPVTAAPAPTVDAAEREFGFER